MPVIAYIVLFTLLFIVCLLIVSLVILYKIERSNIQSKEILSHFQRSGTEFSLTEMIDYHKHNQSVDYEIH